MAEELFHWIWLSGISGVGPRMAGKILSHFGSAERAFDADEAAVRTIPGIQRAGIASILDRTWRSHARRIEYTVFDLNISYQTLQSPGYPPGLRDLEDPPLVLYYKGRLPEKRSVGIVGSRHASDYGRFCAKHLARELASAGVAVISGLALGIDKEAHAGALEAQGVTAAVMGTGVDLIYPAVHKKIAEQICQQGALISEYPPGTQASPYHFPARNRIISALSSGTVVIEAGEKSGSLITAACALDIGREVMAVPGNITAPGSAGTHRLIQDGARLVTCAEDILACTGLNKGISGEQAPLVAWEGLEHDARLIVEYIGKHKQVSFDELIQHTGLLSPELHASLFMLELSGIIVQQPGKLFALR